jgi:Holliday junction resolvase RusA-like endonuclease
MSLASFRILGLPAPQGSKKTVGTRVGKQGQAVPIMVESSKELPKWRKSVEKQAFAQWRNPPLDQPLVVVMTFTLPKPASAPKTRRTWPDKKPDVSKLARAVEDSLTDAGVFADDARIVDLIARKRFPNEGAGALSVPGVVVHVFDALRHEADVFELDADQPAQLDLAA